LGKKIVPRNKKIGAQIGKELKIGPRIKELSKSQGKNVVPN